MSENLKVNANSSVLEHKRKHNLLVDGLPEIIDEKMQQGETMEGYAFALGIKENLTIDGIYASAVKNGNKLTLVLAVDLIRTGTVVGDITVGTFQLPEEVADKIYPSLVGDYYFVDNRVIDAWYNDSNFADLSSFVRKGSGADKNNLYFIMNVGPVNDKLSIDAKAYYRYELTILLSDNLIPETQGE